MTSEDELIQFQTNMAENLHIRSTSQSIDSLLTSRRKTIKYDASYQRNYVWNNDKATFFIESILIGVEIPPLIFFVHAYDKKTLEVIDGRQRYETIERFKTGKFSLSKNGLRKLKELAGKKYQDLHDHQNKNEKYRRAFNNTTLRIIEFSSKNPLLDKEKQIALEDKISKEIFRRYNTGITPLKKVEVKNARHEGDSFTKLMKRQIEDNSNGWVTDFNDLFFKIKPQNITPELTMGKLRDLVVLEYFPINIYASSSERSEITAHLFQKYIEINDSEGSLTVTQQQKLQQVINKIPWLKRLKQQLGDDEWLIYQCIYWALTVIENEGMAIDSVFNPNLIQELSKQIRNKILLFTGPDKGLTSTTNARFKLIANFFACNTGVDFSDYLQKPRKKLALKYSDHDFKEQRLARQEAETTTVENLILKMVNNEYQLRPPYQRQEVINNKKASGLMESILLGIPLPTIFIYRRNDGINEVVDGQQRLLSLLGYIGPERSELFNGATPKTMMESKKDKKFKLAKNLPILTKAQNKSFTELDEDQQDQIWDFELSIVYINQDTNPDFDPIDLFIRLNDKSYDIKDPSFEMWNSYVAPKMMEDIKGLADDYKPWFYYIKGDRRMKLEELLLSFAYIDWGSAKTDMFTPMQIYQALDNPITFRVENLKIDDWLNRIDQDKTKTELRQGLNSINNVRAWIEKISFVLGHELDHPQKAQRFDELISLTTKARNQRGFYFLWLLLAEIDCAKIKDNCSQIFIELQRFIHEYKTIHREEEQQQSVKQIFQQLVIDFWLKWR